MTVLPFRLARCARPSILAVVIALCSFLEPVESQPLPDHQVKAAFFLRFASYMEASPSPNRSDLRLSMCITGGDPFQGALERLVYLQQGGGRREIAVRHIAPGESVADCHFLFLAHAKERDILAALETTRRHGIVTVSDFPGFIKIGGIVELFLEGRKVYFKINQLAAEREGIKVSSRVLTLAKELIQ